MAASAPTSELSIGMLPSETSVPTSAPVASATTPAVSRPESQWLRDRWLPLAMLAIALPVAIVTAWRTLDWLEPGGKPFPGFFVMENGIVPTVGLFHWTGMTHRMPFAARIVAADGHAIRSNADVYDHVASIPTGTVVEYTIEHDGKRETRRVPTMLFQPFDYALTLGLYALNGFMGLLAGFVVCLLRPRNAAARGFLLFGFFWGLYPLTGTALFHPGLAWVAPWYLVAQAVFPATFIHFGLVFPVERELIRRHRTILVVPYLISAALLAWIFHSYLR